MVKLLWILIILISGPSWGWYLLIVFSLVYGSLLTKNILDCILDIWNSTLHGLLVLLKSSGDCWCSWFSSHLPLVQASSFLTTLFPPFLCVVVQTSVRFSEFAFCLCFPRWVQELVWDLCDYNRKLEHLLLQFFPLWGILLILSGLLSVLLLARKMAGLCQSLSQLSYSAGSRANPKPEHGLPRVPLLLILTPLRNLRAFVYFA